MQFFNFFSNIFDKFFIFDKKFLGIDIGNFSIKLAEISKKGDIFKLLVVDEIVVPKDEKKPITDDEISKILSILIDRNKIRTKRAIFSIENSFTNYAIITLPKIEGKEIEEYIRLNFDYFLPIPFKDIYLEWKILEKNEDNTKILLIAVNKEIVLRYKKIAQNAKLNFYSFETEANALINSLINKTENDEIVIILDVRMKNSSLSLIKNGYLFRSSSLDISVNNFDFKTTKSPEDKIYKKLN